MDEMNAGTIDSDTTTADRPVLPRMAELVQTFDWESTPLGPMEKWPDGLKNTVRILLTSRFSMWMGWGPELTFLYNDSYARTTLGKKHPWALGKPASEVWSEIWKDIGPLVHRVMDTGEATWEETLLLILERSGFPEETYHTFSYSPLEGPDGKVAGMLCVVIENTTRVIGERQLSGLSALSGELAGAISKQDVFAAIERGLSNHKDMPCTLTYLLNEEGTHLHLVARTGMDADHPAAATSIDLGWNRLRGRSVTFWNRIRPSPSITCSSNSLTCPRDAGTGLPLARESFRSRAKGKRNLSVSSSRPQSLPGFRFVLWGVSGSCRRTNRREHHQRPSLRRRAKRAESLAELDRAKTTFFSNVSHELRTPLTLILGPIEDASTSQTQPSLPSVEMMQRNTQRLLKLVNGLLDFVRIEVGRVRASLNPLIFPADRTSGQRLPFRSGKRRIATRCGMLAATRACLRRPGDVGEGRAEPAVERAEVDVRRRDSCGPYRVDGDVHFTVTDTGTGISERTRRTCSSAFSESKERAGGATKAVASASRWCGNWWRCMVARSGWTASWDVERHSPWCFLTGKSTCRRIS